MRPDGGVDIPHAGPTPIVIHVDDSAAADAREARSC
jgi:hypothetical protein